MTDGQMLWGLACGLIVFILMMFVADRMFMRQRRFLRAHMRRGFELHARMKITNDENRKLAAELNADLDKLKKLREEIDAKQAANFAGRGHGDND